MNVLPMLQYYNTNCLGLGTVLYLTVLFVINKHTEGTLSAQNGLMLYYSNNYGHTVINTAQRRGSVT